jgi:Tfp pilus assembly protein PilZ
MIIGKTMCLLVFVYTTFSNVNAQNSIATNLTQQFSSYNQYHAKEKIFVHTDKTFYLAGERIWFKAYITSTSSNLPVNLSKVAYIELLNPENTPVLQTKINIDKTGEGSILLPVSIATGKYIMCLHKLDEKF